MNKKVKKVACVLGVAMTVCMCQFLISPTTAFASTTNSEYSKVSVTNSSFEESTSKTSLITSVTGWNNGNGNAKKGVLHVDNTSSYFDNACKNQYHLYSTENPGEAGTDHKVLMINSKTEAYDDTSTTASDYYYSNDITLEAYSYYQISVWANTIENAYASIALTGFNDTDMTDASETVFAGVQTFGGVGAWTKYSFLVSTGVDSQAVSLKLALGTLDDETANMTASKGTVFFDEIEVLKFSENYYYQLATDPDLSSTTKFVTYEKYDVTPADFNLDFENGLENWEKFGSYTNQQYTAGVQLVSKIEQGSDYSYNNTKALVLSADEDNALYVGYKTSWQDTDENAIGFDVKMNTAYEVSVMAKAIDLNGSATIKLVETDYLEKTYSNDKTTPTTSTITISSTSTNQLTNDYTEYKFYILGYELYDTQFNIELALGTESANAYGSIAFDDITIRQISYDTFNNISESTNLINKVTLTTVTSDPTITNGNFNSAHSETAILDYPLTPDDWTQTSTKGNAIFGVVNTTTWEDIDATKRPIAEAPVNPDIELSDGIVIPGDNYSTNNFLMMYNPTSATQVVTSPTFSASADSYYILSFNLRSFGQNTLSFKIINDENNVVFQDDNINTSTKWETYKIFFKTEYSSAETLKLEITLDNYDTNAKTYAFFDNFQFYTPANYTDSTFSNAVDNNLHTVDLSNLGFQQKGEYNQTTKMYEAIMFDGALVEGTQISSSYPIATGGIIDEYNDFGITFPATHINSVKNMLRIETQTTADYTITSKNTISLSSDSYYKFSVYIKTSLTETNSNNVGAYLNLVGLEDAKFEKLISTQDFKLFTIYVSTNSDADVQIQFGLKSDSITTTQSALFDTFTFETIDKTAFLKATNTNSTLVLNNAHVTQADDESEDDTSTQSSASASSILLALGTIILVVAFVVAIIGAFIRKARKQKVKAKKQKEYEQKASMVRDASSVEAEKRRNNEIAELIKEKHQLEEYLKELEQDNKQRLAEQRRANGKTITHKAEKEFKLYAKHRQNIIRDMGRIDERIKEAQTPEYLMRIIKIVQNEKVKAMEEKETAQEANTSTVEQSKETPKPIDENANAIEQLSNIIDKGEVKDENNSTDGDKK